MNKIDLEAAALELHARVTQRLDADAVRADTFIKNDERAVKVLTEIENKYLAAMDTINEFKRLIEIYC